MENIISASDQVQWLDWNDEPSLFEFEEATELLNALPDDDLLSSSDDLFEDILQANPNIDEWLSEDLDFFDILSPSSSFSSVSLSQLATIKPRPKLSHRSFQQHRYNSANRIDVDTKKPISKLVLLEQEQLGEVSIIKRKTRDNMDHSEPGGKKRKPSMTARDETSPLDSKSETFVLIVEFLIKVPSDAETNSVPLEAILMTGSGARKSESLSSAAGASLPSRSFKFRVSKSEDLGNIDIVLVNVSPLMKCSGAIVHLTTGDQNEQLSGPLYVKSTEQSRSTVVLISPLRISADGRLEIRDVQSMSTYQASSHAVLPPKVQLLSGDTTEQHQEQNQFQFNQDANESIIADAYEFHEVIQCWSARNNLDASIPLFDQDLLFAPALNAEPESRNSVIKAQPDALVPEPPARAPLINYDDAFSKEGWKNLEEIKLRLKDVRKTDYLSSVTKEDLAQLTNLSRAEISEGLGICLSLAKKIFRAHGLHEWVYRYLSPIRARMKRLVTEFDSKVCRNAKLTEQQARSQRDIYESEMNSLFELHQRTAQTFLDNWK